MIILTRLALLSTLLAPLTCNAFLTSPPPAGSRNIADASKYAAPLYGRYDPYSRGSGDSSRDDASARNKARTDFRSFLTQRSIQSFVFLLNQCRDEHTVRWIEKTIGFKGIDSYHGTGAFNTTIFPAWDSIFLDLVTRPADTVVVTVKSRQRRRGFGPQNNYMENLGNKNNVPSKTDAPNKKKNEQTKANPKPVARAGFGLGSYLDNLSSSNNSNDKAGSVGNAEAKKPEKTWQKKPKTSKPVAPTGTGLPSYLDNLSSKNSETTPAEAEKVASNNKPRKNPFLEEKKIEFEIDIDPASLLTRIISVREQISREWSRDLETLIQTNDQILVSYVDNQKEARAASEEDDYDEDEEDDDEDEEFRVEDLTAPYSDRSNNDEVIVFDKDAMVMLTNSISNEGKDSTPFRRSNFDLLVLLSTQESIHRVLRQYREEDDQAENFGWLREFYSQRVKNYFDGHQPTYGRADKFLEELLLSPPSVLHRKGGNVQFIDPMKMAEDIIKMRSEVAKEWKKIVINASEEHVDLRRLLLTRRMMEQSEPNPLDEIITTIVEEEQTKTGVFLEIGAFE